MRSTAKIHVGYFYQNVSFINYNEILARFLSIEQMLLQIFLSLCVKSMCLCNCNVIDKPYTQSPCNSRKLLEKFSWKKKLEIEAKGKCCISNFHIKISFCDRNRVHCGFNGRVQSWEPLYVSEYKSLTAITITKQITNAKKATANTKSYVAK